MRAAKYTTILFDADGTLLDFERSEREAISEAMVRYGIEPTDENVRMYSEINDGLWKQLERGEIEKSELIYRRFELLFERLLVSASAYDMCEDYMSIISTKGYVLEGAEQMCRELFGKFKLYIVTNGAQRVQLGRYAVCRIDRYFDGLFISDVIGHQKPSVKFFEYVAEHIEGFDRSRTLIVGDSLTSDMRGGLNFGIDCCWYNPSGAERPADMNITYEAKSFAEITDFIMGEI